MTALTDERTYRTADLAERLGVPPVTVMSWALAWYGPTGSGNWRHLTTVDALVARAWQVLGGARNGNRYGHVPARYRDAEQAIRAHPRRWLLIAGPVAETHDSAEVCAVAWLHSGQPAGQVIDLWSTPT